MGFFQDASESIFRYSEKLVNKTEEYAKIAKLNMDIKRFESAIEKTEKEIGRFIIDRADLGENEAALSSGFIADEIGKVRGLREEIARKRDEIAAVKHAGASGNSVKTTSADGS